MQEGIIAFFETPEQLRARLRKTGLTGEAIDAAWPDWWSDGSAGSLSAEAELRFTLARNLGLSPGGLMEPGDPTFVWRDSAKFKRLTGDEPAQRVLSAFARAFASAVDQLVETQIQSLDHSASSLREAILRTTDAVRLVDLLSLAWGLGVPVTFLHVFPATNKSMDAMTSTSRTRPVVMLGRQSTYEASLAFTLAHELGHIFLGHLDQGATVVDVGDPLEPDPEGDPEEAAANAFAKELLTGHPEFDPVPSSATFNAGELAVASIKLGAKYAIDPAMVALCAAFGTNDWARGYGALKVMGLSKEGLPTAINDVAARELRLRSRTSSASTFVSRVLGRA